MLEKICSSGGCDDTKPSAGLFYKLSPEPKLVNLHFPACLQRSDSCSHKSSTQVSCQSFKKSNMDETLCCYTPTSKEEREKKKKKEWEETHGFQIISEIQKDLCKAGKHPGHGFSFPHYLSGSVSCLPITCSSGTGKSCSWERGKRESPAAGSCWNPGRSELSVLPALTPWRTFQI